MTFDELKDTLGEAYLEMKKSGVDQAVVVPWELLQLMRRVVEDADKCFDGDGQVTEALADSINALENYDSENQQCNLH